MELASPLAQVSTTYAVEPGYEEVPCNLCGGRNTRTVHSSRRLIPIEALDPDRYFACTSTAFGECGPIVRCEDCGLMYLNPRPTPDRILGAYQRVVDLRYDEERDGRFLTFQASLRDLERHTQGGRLLDVGCLTGVFMQVARARSWDVVGIEPSEWAAFYARRQGLQIHHGVLADYPIEWGQFDAITCWDVIEHLSNPIEELRHMWHLMQPGGLLAISTMNVESLAPRLLGRRWPWFMQMHLYYFSPQTLGTMLRKAGFEVLELARHRRIVRLSYLVSRLNPYSRIAHRIAAWLIEKLAMEDVPVTVDLGDLFVTHARKVG